MLDVNPSLPISEQRLQAIGLLQAGAKATDVARCFNVSAATLHRWLRNFNQRGRDAIGHPTTGGRPRKLLAHVVSQLAADLKTSPATFGYPQKSWSGALVSRRLMQHYSIRISPRHCLRLIRESGLSAPATHGAKPHKFVNLAPASTDPARRPRPAWDGLNREIALRRIKRLASSGLALEPFVLTLFDLIETAVPGGTRKALIADPGDHPDAFIVNYDPKFLAEILPAFQRFMVDAAPEESGMRVKFDPYSLKHAFLAKTVWPLEEFMLPHYYRSAGYNEVIRPLNQRHGAWIVYQEHGQTAGFYPFWRDPDQRPLSRDDLSFLSISAPHIAHGLRTAQLLSRRGAKVADASFDPISAWGTGILLMDSAGRLVAADARARAYFGQLQRFDAKFQLRPNALGDRQVFPYIARVLNRVFSKGGELEAAAEPPVVRLYSHWSGVAIRMRGLLTAGLRGKNYFTVLVERGELEPERRLSYRWGLSSRELQILAALARGQSAAEMAQNLKIQRDTLKSYSRRLIDKLDLPDVAALRTFAQHTQVALSAPPNPMHNAPERQPR